MCVFCSLRYPACKAQHHIIFQLWPAWLYHISPHYLTNGTIFWGKKVTEHKICAWFHLELFPETSHCKKNSAIYYHRCTLGLHVKHPLFLSDGNGTLIFSTDFRKSTFTKIRPVEAVVPCGPKDGRSARNDEISSRLSEFCEWT